MALIVLTFRLERPASKADLQTWARALADREHVELIGLEVEEEMR